MGTNLSSSIDCHNHVSGKSFRIFGAAGEATSGTLGRRLNANGDAPNAAIGLSPPALLNTPDDS